MLDLDMREMAVLAPLVVLTILFGVTPKPVLDISQASVAALLDNYHQALGTRAAAAGHATMKRGQRRQKRPPRQLANEAIGALTFAGLYPVLPELVLALGAMVIADDRRLCAATAARRAACCSAGGVLVLAGDLIVTMPPKATRFRRQLRDR